MHLNRVQYSWEKVRIEGPERHVQIGQNRLAVGAASMSAPGVSNHQKNEFDILLSYVGLLVHHNDGVLVRIVPHIPYGPRQHPTTTKRKKRSQLGEHA